MRLRMVCVTRVCGFALPAYPAAPHLQPPTGYYVTCCLLRTLHYPYLYYLPALPAAHLYLPHHAITPPPYTYLTPYLPTTTLRFGLILRFTAFCSYARCVFRCLHRFAVGLVCLPFVTVTSHIVPGRFSCALPHTRALDSSRYLPILLNVTTVLPHTCGFRVAL